LPIITSILVSDAVKSAPIDDTRAGMCRPWSRTMLLLMTTIVRPDTT